MKYREGRTQSISISINKMSNTWSTAHRKYHTAYRINQQAGIDQKTLHHSHLISIIK